YRCCCHRAVLSSAAAKRSSPPAAGSTAGATWAKATRNACGSCGTERPPHGLAGRRRLGPTAGGAATGGRLVVLEEAALIVEGDHIAGPTCSSPARRSCSETAPGTPCMR